jgi:hypothetical protein
MHLSVRKPEPQQDYGSFIVRNRVDAPCDNLGLKGEGRARLLKALHETIYHESL